MAEGLLFGLDLCHGSIINEWLLGLQLEFTLSAVQYNCAPLYPGSNKGIGLPVGCTQFSISYTVLAHVQVVWI